jgi:IMP dehydrogenase
VITVRDGVDRDEAKRLLHQHRIEKLLVVDDDYRCIGLITVKDIEKARSTRACKDEQGRLRVAAATGVGEDGIARAEALFDAEVDVLVIDTAHGHSEGVLKTRRPAQAAANYTQVIAGNVATADGARALIDAGADAVKVGIGPGSICTTRMVAGVGVPQLHRAIIDVAEVCRGPTCRPSPTAASSIPATRQGDRRRRRRAMIGSLFAGTDEARARSSSIRAAPTRPIAAWARSARWPAARPTATSSRRSATS